MTSTVSENKLAKIIQNVKIRIADDGELQVKVPDDILEHYKKDTSFQNYFSNDGWYCTNTIGKKTSAGIIIVKENTKNPSPALPKGKGASSKSPSLREGFRMGSEDTIASAMQVVIEGKCHYISSSLIMGAGGNYPVAILFPDTNFLSHPDYQISPMEGCFCPRDLQELGKCLNGCLNDANCEIGQRFTKIKTFLIIENE